MVGVAMSNTNSSVAAFTPEASHTALVEACKSIGVDESQAVLIRLGEIAIYHVPNVNLVVRIARGLDVVADARKEVAVSRWLHSAGLCAAEVADYEQPIISDGRP